MSRYEIDVLSRDERGNPNLWGVRDLKAGGGWVLIPDEEGQPTDEPLWFPMPYSAESWCRNQRYLEEVGNHG